MTQEEMAQKWIDALRSGEYKQTRGRLQDDAGFCCLGVACKIFIPKEDQILDHYGHLSGAMPSLDKGMPESFMNLKDEFGRKTGQTFVKFNDSGHINEYGQLIAGTLTFDEIADLIQLVFIEKVLDA